METKIRIPYTAFYKEIGTGLGLIPFKEVGPALEIARHSKPFAASPSCTFRARVPLIGDRGGSRTPLFRSDFSAPKRDFGPPSLGLTTETKRRVLPRDSLPFRGPRVA